MREHEISSDEEPKIIEGAHVQVNDCWRSNQNAQSESLPNENKFLRAHNSISSSRATIGCWDHHPPRKLGGRQTRNRLSAQHTSVALRHVTHIPPVQGYNRLGNHRCSLHREDQHHHKPQSSKLGEIDASTTRTPLRTRSERTTSAQRRLPTYCATPHNRVAPRHPRRHGASIGSI